MIDFRYHLVSIIAVLLALSIGIATGSGFLGGRLLDEVRSAAQRVAARNRELRLTNAEETRRADAAQAALEALEPELLDDRLAGRRVVMIEFEGADDGASSQIRTAFQRAGADVTATIRFSDELALADPVRRDLLAAALNSSHEDRTALRLDLADVLGGALASAVRSRLGAGARLGTFLTSLRETGLVTLEGDTATFPPGAEFVIAGGGASAPPWPVSEFCVALGRRLAARDGVALVVEPSQSIWGLVAGVRRDQAAEQSVATVDNGDSVIGRIAATIVLEQAPVRPVQHYGTAPGASAIMPSAEG